MLDPKRIELKSSSGRKEGKNAANLSTTSSASSAISSKYFQSINFSGEDSFLEPDIHPTTASNKSSHSSDSSTTSSSSNAAASSSAASRESRQKVCSVDSQSSDLDETLHRHHSPKCSKNLRPNSPKRSRSDVQEDLVSAPEVESTIETKKAVTPHRTPLPAFPQPKLTPTQTQSMSRESFSRSESTTLGNIFSNTIHSKL